MQDRQEDTNERQPGKLQDAILFLTKALRSASANSPGQPDHGRAGVRMALVGVIEFLSELYPDKPSWAVPLNQLLYGLDDLDRGKVVPLFEPTKISSRPRDALSDELFRALPAAAMTRLVDGKVMSCNDAAREIVKQLARMGYKHASGRPITHGQIAKWREKMMTERASENKAVARYQLALEWVKDMKPREAVDFLLKSLSDLHPPNFPKNPPS